MKFQIKFLVFCSFSMRNMVVMCGLQKRLEAVELFIFNDASERIYMPYSLLVALRFVRIDSIY